MITWYTKRELIPSTVKFINNNDCYFFLTELSDDDVTNRVLSTIDKAKYNSNNTIIGRDEKLGALNSTCLSTGAKTLLNVYKHPDVCFSLEECGLNALMLIVNLSTIITGFVYFPDPPYFLLGVRMSVLYSVMT
jgi:hypothetical protein